ncbi:MAG: O-antigen ligase family protein [Flavobacteriales bacterium]|nr:O-antigen ligase family protein [Flavobacteriales bacterium]
MWWSQLILSISIPLSVKLYSMPYNIEVIAPAEALVIVVLLLTGFGLLSGRLQLRRELLLTALPMAVCGLLCFGWVCVFFSGMPYVSCKAMAVRTAYILVFFFIPLMIGENARVRHCLGAALLALLPVVAIALGRQLPEGPDRANASHASFPFFADHTIYSAAIVFGLIGVACAAFYGSIGKPQRQRTLLHWCVALLLLVACYASFSRAAWLSIAITFVFALAMWVGMRWRGLIWAVILILPLLIALGWRLQKGPMTQPRDSNGDNASWKEAVLSVPNITTDASNMARMNRWFCALRMVRQRPLWGFGPGTYQFQYIQFQQASQTTYLSWNETIDTRAIAPAMDLRRTGHDQSYDRSLLLLRRHGS